MSALLRAGKPAEADEGLIAALAAILADKTLEPAFVSLALTMPSEADIAREIGRDVDPDANFAARAHLRSGIGAALGCRAGRDLSTSSRPRRPTARMPPAPAGAR